MRSRSDCRSNDGGIPTTQPLPHSAQFSQGPEAPTASDQETFIHGQSESHGVVDQNASCSQAAIHTGGSAGRPAAAGAFAVRVWCWKMPPFDVAEKIYTHLSKNFFDWNEVRVSTVTELAEVDPAAARSGRRGVESQARAARRVRIDVFVRSRTGEKAEYLRGDQATGTARRHDPVQPGLRDASRAGRPCHSAGPRSPRRAGDAGRHQRERSRSRAKSAGWSA